MSQLTRPFSNLQKEVTKLKVTALDTLLRDSTHTTPGHLLRRLAPTIISRAWTSTTIRLIGLPKRGFLSMLRGFLLLMPLKQPNAEVNQLLCGCDALFCSKDGCKAVDKRMEDTGLHQRSCAFTGTIAATMLKETMAGLVVQASPVHNVRPEGITEPPTNQFIPGSILRQYQTRRLTPG